MEAFQLLSRGGAFDKQRFKNDVQLFNVCAATLPVDHLLDIIRSRRNRSMSAAQKSMVANCPRSLISSSTQRAGQTNGRRRSKICSTRARNRR
jgi:hypothetical protein